MNTYRIFHISYQAFLFYLRRFISILSVKESNHNLRITEHFKYNDLDLIKINDPTYKIFLIEEILPFEKDHDIIEKNLLNPQCEAKNISTHQSRSCISKFSSRCKIVKKYQIQNCTVDSINEAVYDLSNVTYVRKVRAKETVIFNDVSASNSIITTKQQDSSSKQIRYDQEVRDEFKKLLESYSTYLLQLKVDSEL